MKAVEILNRERRHVFTKFLNAVYPRPGLVAMATGAALVITAPLTANAQSVDITSPLRDVAERTLQLLSAPLTMAQRQVLHAQNFSQLPLALRPVYLHAVSYAVGFTVASGGQVPSSAKIAEHLTALGGGGGTLDIYNVPSLSPEVSQQSSTFLPIVHNTLQQLNTLISTQVANNPGYQQAMYAGAVCGIDDWISPEGA